MVVWTGTAGTRSNWRNMQRTVVRKQRQRVGHRGASWPPADAASADASNRTRHHHHTGVTIMAPHFLLDYVHSFFFGRLRHNVNRIAPCHVRAEQQQQLVRWFFFYFFFAESGLRRAHRSTAAGGLEDAPHLSAQQRSSETPAAIRFSSKEIQ